MFVALVSSIVYVVVLPVARRQRIVGIDDFGGSKSGGERQHKTLYRPSTFFSVPYLSPLNIEQ